MADAKRFRNWAFVVYPESAPENWLQILDDLHVPCLVSPLHDQDINADGTPKKPHYHVMLMFEGVKTSSQVKQISIDMLHGVNPISLASTRAYGRYLIHLDNPEKHQYSRLDIRSFGGADIDKILASSVASRHADLREMRKFIKDNQIFSFADFLDYCDENRPEWSELLDDNSTMVISNYIKSRIYDRRETLSAQVAELQNKNIELQRLLLDDKNRDNQLAHDDPFKDC